MYKFVHDEHKFTFLKDAICRTITRETIDEINDNQKVSGEDEIVLTINGVEVDFKRFIDWFEETFERELNKAKKASLTDEVSTLIRDVLAKEVKSIQLNNNVEQASCSDECCRNCRHGVYGACEITKEKICSDETCEYFENDTKEVLV